MLSKENKTIYRNTIIIYIRMIIVTLLGLFSSRFVLQALGASDYGLYNVVGGLIAMLNFISTAMTTTTRRFINVEMGKPEGNLNMVFNVSLLLHISFAVCILIVAETIGIWYVNNMLNVAEGKLHDAMFVFQISTIVACIGIINVPYQSLIEANEQFGKVAIIDILTTLIKFVLVLILLLYEGNALRFYAISVCLVTLVSFMLYHGVCFRNWRGIIAIKLYKKTSLYKEILVYNNYTALGAGVLIGKTQGSNLLVNYFFGTVVNAAFAIASQVQSCVYMFVNKLTLATNPQVAKNYAGGSMDRVNMLIEKNSKYSILIMTIFFYIMSADLVFILNLWLKEVPEGAVLMCQLTLIDALVRSFSEGTNGFVQASGKIKWFQIVGSIFLLSNLPIGYFLFKIGFEPYTIIICFIVSNILSSCIGLCMMSKILHFDSITYVKKAYLRPLAIIMIMGIFCYVNEMIEKISSLQHLLGIAVISTITIFLVLFIGLDYKEKEILLVAFKKWIK